MPSTVDLTDELTSLRAENVNLQCEVVKLREEISQISKENLVFSAPTVGACGLAFEIDPETDAAQAKAFDKFFNNKDKIDEKARSWILS